MLGWPTPQGSFTVGMGALGTRCAPHSNVAAQGPMLRDPRCHAELSADATTSESSGSSGAAVGTVLASAVVAMAAGLAHSFGVVVPRRRAASHLSNQEAVASASGGAFAVSVGNSVVSSRASAFLGSSMAGSVTVAAPERSSSKLLSMKMMFEKFNERAIKAVMTAQEESRRLGHNFVSTEMLLVGVIAQNTGPVANVMKKLGVNVKDARKKVEDVLGRGSGVVSNEVPFTPAAKRMLGSGIEQAKQMNSETIDTSHILLALVKEKDGGVAKVFEKLNVDPSKIPDDIMSELKGSTEKEAGQERQLVGMANKGGGAQAKATSVLEEFGKDLTAAAARGEMDPLVGREEEIERVVQILARRQKNNPVLIGEPGVGKSAIAEGLALRIAAGDVPEIIRGKRIIEMELGMLLSGTKYRGEFEERMKNIIQACKQDKNVILMIDEIHTIVGAGGDGGGGAMDAANIMKPALSRGDLQVIGATTVEEYRKYVEKDKALERRFQPVSVPEPSVEQTIQILQGLARKYEAHHKLRYSDEAIEGCVKLASQYIQDRFLPDKAIDVLDEAGARVQLRQLATIPEAAKTVRAELREVQAQKEAAVNLQDYSLAAELRVKEEELRRQVGQIMAEEAKAEGSEGATTEDLGDDPFAEPVVTESDVASVVSTWTGVPVDKVSSDESARLVQLENVLHQRVIGQEEAVVAISKAVRRSRAGLQNPNRPIASFIFCGPTGVGKTELCKALAAAYYGREDAMIRLDMSEFMERHTVSKLIGSPPGYVGYDEESQLTDGIRRKPYSLVLFDEVEKAHPDVFNLMLQILEDGRLTDSKGRLVSFKNAMIIMTSNAGAKQIEKSLIGGDIGFSSGDPDEGGSTYQRLKTRVHEELKNFFRPEFLNRLDEIIVFKSLTKPEVREISALEFKKTNKRCEERGVKLSLTERFKQKVVDEGFNPVYGARPLRRAVMRLLEDKLAESFLNEPTVEGEYVVCDLDKHGEVVVLRQQEPAEQEGDQQDGEGVVVLPDMSSGGLPVSPTVPAKA